MTGSEAARRDRQQDDRLQRVHRADDDVQTAQPGGRRGVELRLRGRRHLRSLTRTRSGDDGVLALLPAERSAIYDTVDTIPTSSILSRNEGKYPGCRASSARRALWPVRCSWPCWRRQRARETFASPSTTAEAQLPFEPLVPWSSLRWIGLLGACVILFVIDLAVVRGRGGEMTTRTAAMASAGVADARAAVRSRTAARRRRRRREGVLRRLSRRESGRAGHRRRTSSSSPIA